MNKERTGLCVRQTKHIRDPL